MTYNRVRKGFTLAAVLASGMLGATSANAASVTYIVNDTNVAQFTGGLPDGGDYARVTIDDLGGTINFTVDVVTIADGGVLVPTNNFGIQSFAFNLSGITLATTANPTGLEENDITGLSTGWAVATQNGGPNAGYIKPSNANGYGQFDVLVGDGGQNRKDPLTFSIDYAGDSIGSYFAPSTGGGQPPAWFGVHITGIETGAYTWDADSSFPECSVGDTPPAGYEGSSCLELPSAWFGSTGEGDQPPNAIPVPAAVWLFGSGLLGLVGVARRRRTA